MQWRLRERAGRIGAVVWVILVLALVLRVITVVATFHTPLSLDPFDFSRTAASIADGNGYPPTNRGPGGGASAFRPPGYPVVLAGVYWLTSSRSPGVGRLAGALLGTLSVGLIGLVARRLWGRRVAVLALGIAAIAPPLIIFSTALISEALFVPLVLAAVLAALHARGSPRPYRWAIATGVLTGLAALTRTNGAILLIPFLCAFAPVGAWRRARAWGPPLAVVVAAALTIAPWTIRNWAVFRAFIPVSDETGYTLAGTYNEVSRAAHRYPALWIEAEHGASPEYARILATARRRHWNEPTYGSHLQAAAIADIKRDPAYVLKVALYNGIRMFHLGEVSLDLGNLRDTDIPRWLGLIETNTFPLLGVLGLGGLLSRRARRVPKWLWLVPLSLLTTLFVTGFVRFRAPIDPFFVLLAALLVADIGEQVAHLRRGLSALSHAQPRDPGGFTR
jgi:4-amino-4-deoxy-L-arabinose transferase-like glycosyltransferase